MRPPPLASWIKALFAHCGKTPSNNKTRRPYRPFVETLEDLVDIGVDAVILQDLGVYHLICRHFPSLELHASTQLAVHNRAGSEALSRLGFKRVVLARELTFEEVERIKI